MTVSAAASRRLAALALVAAAVAGPSTGQVPPGQVPPGQVPPDPALPEAPPPADAGAPTAGPKSLLPDSFGPSRDTPVAAAPLATAAPAAAAPSTAAATPSPATASPAELPPPAGPAIDLAGPLTSELGGYGTATFSGSNGRFVAGLMRRQAAPGASRWAHIVLRRALLSASAAPAGINPADWIAERARLLLATGEVDGAKALIDNLAADRFTPRLYRVAGQVDLAAADLPALCPLADTGSAVSPDPVWRLAEAMCAGMAGDDISAASGFDGLRDGDAVDPFDVLLGERIATVSGSGGRAANLDWEAIDHLTPYRFGVATAAGAAIPPPLLARLGAETGGASWGWVLRSAGVAPAVRAASLAPAAAIGIASAAEFVAAVSAASADLDREALDASAAGTLRQAYAAATAAERVAAMKKIWASAASGPAAYAASIETALAAARLPADRNLVGDAPELIASMLSAGIEDRAARWWPLVRERNDVAGARAWALLATGTAGGIEVTPDRFRAWRKAVSGDGRRAQLLLAGLTGLGRARGSEWDALRHDEGLAAVGDSWTRAIDAAAAGGRTGEVAVLATTGLQSTWSGVPAAYLARIVAAYVAVGRGHEARMLAAEALARG